MTSIQTNSTPISDASLNSLLGTYSNDLNNTFTSTMDANTLVNSQNLLIQDLSGIIQYIQNSYPEVVQDQSTMGQNASSLSELYERLLYQQNIIQNKKNSLLAIEQNTQNQALQLNSSYYKYIIMLILCIIGVFYIFKYSSQNSSSQQTGGGKRTKKNYLLLFILFIGLYFIKLYISK